MRAGGVIRATPKDAARAAACLQPAFATSSAGVSFIDHFATLAGCGFAA
jgi:hypothetical protein